MSHSVELTEREAEAKLKNLTSRWRAWICPECGTPDYKPWPECWHVCTEPAYHPQGYDPSDESGVQWVRMVAIDRGVLRQLARHRVAKGEDS